MRVKPTVGVAQALFFLNAAVWLAFGVLWLTDTTEGTPGETTTAWIIGILMLANVGAMLLSGIGLGTRRRLFFFFALAVLIVNLVLTFTDQFGLFDLFDLITLVIDLVLLALLIAIRKRYTRSSDSSPSPS